MSIRRIGTAVTAAGLSSLLCAVAATPAQADTPSSWESQALGLSSAHRTSQGQGVKVAVLDSGVEKDHPALAGKVTTGPDFLKDGLQPGDPRWGGHGTAMASDVLKVAPKASILSVRVIDDKKEHEGLQSGPSPVAKGINYAVDHDADVISMSLGGDSFGSSFNDEDTAALARAAHAGVTVIASAGNDGDIFNDSSYPAGYPGVIAVAAVQKGGSRAEFSTVRSYNTVAAPGVGIVSAKNTGGYAAVNGTSPAAALTSGVAALLLAKNDKLRPYQVRELLAKTAAHPSGGWNALVGHGPVNAAAALRAVAKSPANRAAPSAYKGKEHLASPDGTSPIQHPEMETMSLVVGLSAAGVGLLMVIGAILVNRAGRRRGANATPAPAGPGLPGPRH
ncbi:S8 family serine peptidase [Streptomyces sp. NBC_01795]|uniref:S8 family peptidase n=1 Tax=Streptomyces sp. NBC_01795 TaxID=2975943 RepID=UPI002DDA62DB|nr:S8 family serine peptidase [Streptomyces sp. NBC_01795]WSA91228.1 S8 family serine peptidase [Streptomyces sp. NBC_01795]